MTIFIIVIILFAQISMDLFLVSVLLFAHIERLGVYRIRDLFLVKVGLLPKKW